MSLKSRLQAALRSEQPAAQLRTVALDLARDGIAKDRIRDMIEEFMVQQRADVDFREKDEEAVLDLLDALTGECHPAARLLP